jgi:hypothetical protein
VLPTCCTDNRPLVEGRTSIDQPTCSLQCYKAGAHDTTHLLQMLVFMSVPPFFKRTCAQLYLHCCVYKRTKLFESSIEFPLTFLSLGFTFLHLNRMALSTNTGSSLCSQKIVCMCVFIHIYIYTHTHTHARYPKYSGLVPPSIRQLW